MPDQQKYTYEEEYNIIILPSFWSIPYPSNDLPDKVRFIHRGGGLLHIVNYA